MVQLTDEMIKGAQDTERKTGVPASITLGQIMLESSGSYAGGLSGLAYKGNNLFGVKYSSNKYSVIYMKDGNGSLQAWNHYNSIADSIEHHSEILTLDRYKNRYQNATSVADYAKALQDGGYAGNSTTYASTLMTVINNNNLNKYNVNQKVVGAVSGSSSSSSRSGTVNLGFVSIAGNVLGNIIKYIAIVLFIILFVFFMLKALGIDLI